MPEQVPPMNRLAREKSPYLRQHAANPVNWYPWGEEAFDLARRDGKPIFLSIGYSTCHWCHVMAHESFEDQGVAAILNRNFVSIKVDREERPDIDRVYMTFVQATTGSGGWPMSVWLTPDLKPFYGGTYFPPASRWGRPGLREVLEEIIRAWNDEREQVLKSAGLLTERLRGIVASAQPDAVPGPEALAAAVQEFAASFDSRHGGFGQAPKFPRPSELVFLLRESARTGDPAPREMAAHTLQAMAGGGMRDHLGGGFHRYSVDAAWRVPHFEKMLYDQAQLALAYLEAAQIRPDAGFAEVAEETLQYVARDLSDARGGFFSAEDADSLPPEAVGQPDAHAREGAFYLWGLEEIEAIAGPDAPVIRDRFGILPGGNAPADPQDEFGTKNLLYLARNVAAIAQSHGLSESEVSARIARVTRAMLAARNRRPRPHLDNKVLTGWNGLMIAAFARASRVLASPEHLARAERAATFLRDTMWTSESRRLLRRYCDGEAGIDAYAEDYASLVFGLLELFQASGAARWLEWALDLQARMDDLFWDESGGGWFGTTGNDPSVILRIKEDSDGAEPSASSLAVSNLLTIAQLTGEDRWRPRIGATLGAQQGVLTRSPRSAPMMLANLAAYHHGLRQIVLVGRGDDQSMRAMRGVLARTYTPFSVIVPVAPGDGQRDLARLIPSIGSLTAQEGRATAYVCRGFVCDEPTTDVEVFTKQLGRHH